MRLYFIFFKTDLEKTKTSGKKLTFSHTSTCVHFTCTHAASSTVDHLANVCVHLCNGERNVCICVYGG